MTSTIRKSPGPEINGKKTSLLLFDTVSLASSPLLPSLQSMINEAFSDAHPPWQPSSNIRLRTHDQLIRELGPDAFTFVVAYEPDDTEASEVLATVSGIPFKWREPELQDPVYHTWAFWTNPVERNMEVWELKLMAVHVKAQKHGLGAVLMGLHESEVRRRFEEKRLADSMIVSGADADEDANWRRLKLVLITLWEMNYQFYEKRGWTFRDKVYRQKGFMGSETGFHCGAFEKIFQF